MQWDYSVSSSSSVSSVLLYWGKQGFCCCWCASTHLPAPGHLYMCHRYDSEIWKNTPKLSMGERVGAIALPFYLEREEQIRQRFLVIMNARFAAAPAGCCEWKTHTLASLWLSSVRAQMWWAQWLREKGIDYCLSTCSLSTTEAPPSLSKAPPSLSVCFVHPLDTSYPSFDWQRHKQGTDRSACQSLTPLPKKSKFAW